MNNIINNLISPQLSLKLFNSLSGQKEHFVPLNLAQVKMYVCGPTVYSTPHIGNIRSAVVYDIVFRTLKALFPSVVYVRNITDVDDKIIDAAKKSGKEPRDIAIYYESVFHKHLRLLNCLPPKLQPRATENIENMIDMINCLIKNGNAYIAKDHVYFDVNSFSDYGGLSGKKLEDLVHGARVDVQEEKRNPGDFVLWKPDKQCGWQSPWGVGRPGWHIECSAMSCANLGHNFDLHGGGADLKFPHHENEIAQSRCANPDSFFAKYWVHNGFLTVDGQKMSKSLGNVLDLDHLTNLGVCPDVVRLVLISTHYRKPLDWNQKSVEDAKSALIKFKFAVASSAKSDDEPNFADQSECKEFFSCMLDDFNTPAAISVLHKVADFCAKGKNSGCMPALLDRLLLFLGIDAKKISSNINRSFIETKIKHRTQFRIAKNYSEADIIRKELEDLGVFLKDCEEGETAWVSI